MSSEWEKFEIKCFEYLKDEFGRYAEFKHFGESDSTVADVQVTKKDGTKFYIEVKSADAQSGQFVLYYDDEKKFYYSPKNTTKINKYTDKIISYINDNYLQFKTPSTTGTQIVLPEYILAGWVKEYYKSKNVKFFISEKYRIIPLEKIDEYFTISSCYRMKKSGSKELPASDRDNVLDYIKNNFAVKDISFENKRLYVKATNDYKRLKFSIGENEYWFSHKEGEKYEIRKLSKTKNSNVIFSLKLTNHNEGISKESFISFLQSDHQEIL